MPIKETPLLKAVENVDPLPGFLFAHPVLTGWFAMIVSAMFGGVFVLFWALSGTGSQIFEAVRYGMIGGTVVASLVYIGIFISAFFTPDERKHRILFFLGGVLGFATLFFTDYLFADDFRAMIADSGLLICTSQALDCR